MISDGNPSGNHPRQGSQVVRHQRRAFPRCQAESGQGRDSRMAGWRCPPRSSACSTTASARAAWARCGSPIASGSVLDNVNRWLNQFGAEAIDQAGLGKTPQRADRRNHRHLGGGRGRLCVRHGSRRRNPDSPSPGWSLHDRRPHPHRENGRPQGRGGGRQAGARKFCQEPEDGRMIPRITPAPCLPIMEKPSDPTLPQPARSIAGKIFDVLSGFGLATILLLLLGLLTWFATLEQIDNGLYPTLNKYFHWKSVCFSRAESEIRRSQGENDPAATARRLLGGRGAAAQPDARRHHPHPQGLAARGQPHRPLRHHLHARRRRRGPSFLGTRKHGRRGRGVQQHGGGLFRIRRRSRGNQGRQGGPRSMSSAASTSRI